MNFSKRLLMMTCIASIAVGITACGKKKTKRTVATRANQNFVDKNLVNEGTNFTATGRIFGYNGQKPKIFQNAAERLVSTFVQSGIEFGQVSHSPAEGEKTGIRFQGKNTGPILEFSNGSSINTNNRNYRNQSLRLINQQELMLQIQDSLAASGKRLGFEVYFKDLSSLAQITDGNRVVVEFYNEVLSLRFVGNFETYTYNGQDVSFIDGIVYFQDLASTFAPESLGEFYIETCKMIRCTQ